MGETRAERERRQTAESMTPKEAKAAREWKGGPVGDQSGRRAGHPDGWDSGR